MMCVADPWEGRCDRDGDGEVCCYARDENSVVRILVIDEDEDDAENEPGETGNCASTVNPTKVLEDRCAP